MKRLALVFAIILVMLVWMVGVSGAQGPPAQSIISQLQSIQPKKYFITSAKIQGGDAPNACGPGYHMASIFEILDPTHLRYDSTSPLAYKSTSDDLGSGPPTTQAGWIRTGFFARDTGTRPGRANCNGYTSSSPSDFGTTIFLSNEWRVDYPQYYSPPILIAPWWFSDLIECSSPNYGVWCVQD